MRFAFMLPGLVMLAACGNPAPQPDEAGQQKGTVGDVATPGAVPAAANDVVGIPEQGIPAGLQGKWALVPGDCDASRGDDKGALIVSATGLTFYESYAALFEIKQVTQNSIRAVYSFSGEGETWQRDMKLTLSNGGEALVRQDYGAGAAAALEYARCP